MSGASGTLTATGKRILVTERNHQRLAALTRELGIIAGRDITFNEAIEELLGLLDGTSRLARDIATGKESGK